MTLRDFKSFFFNRLKEHFPIKEIQSFYHLLLEHRLNLTRVNAALAPHTIIEASDLSYLNEALSSLIKHKPIQYILGETSFFDMLFKVSPAVLIPRIETEELVSWVLKSAKSINSCEILDIGTGSGCIAISLAKNLPNAKVYGLDISQEALEIAQTNAVLNKVELTLLHIDILKEFQVPNQMDIIVSNPPYVRNLEKNQIDSNVIEYEPHVALFVEDDNPLLFYERIAQLAKKQLKPKGLLYFEINQYLAKETVELLNSIGFKNIELRNDLFNRPRMIKAQLI